MKMLIAAGALLMAGTACAQDGYWAELREYLQLTPSQLSQIYEANRAQSDFEVAKENRRATVYREIAEETAKSPLDPAALGIRYAEIEAIRREIRERQENLRKANVAVLTEAQKARFQTLEDAVKLLPVIRNAESANLMKPVLRCYGIVVSFLQPSLPTQSSSDNLADCPAGSISIGDFRSGHASTR